MYSEVKNISRQLLLSVRLRSTTLSSCWQGSSQYENNTSQRKHFCGRCVGEFLFCCQISKTRRKTCGFCGFQTMIKYNKQSYNRKHEHHPGWSQSLVRSSQKVQQEQMVKQKGYVECFSCQRSSLSFLTSLEADLHPGGRSSTGGTLSGFKLKMTKSK